MTEKAESAAPTAPTVEEVVADLKTLCRWPEDHALIEHAITLLQSLAKDAGRWVPWKPGDALPATAPVLHWTTWFDREYTDVPMMRANYAHDFKRWEVTAYWSQPLPAPYTAIDLARGKS